MYTYSKIIDSARNLFNKYGYKKVSMDEIAYEAGVTKKTVYSYFNDKDSLFEFFVNEQIQNMKDIYEKYDKENKDITEKFHNIIFALVKYKKESEFLNLIIKEATLLKTKSMINFSNKIDESIKSFIKEKIQILLDNKLIKNIDIELGTFIVYNLYFSIMFNYPQDKMDEKIISDTVTTILKDGLFN